MTLNKKSGSKGSGSTHRNFYTAFYPKLGITVLRSKPRRRKANEWTEKQKQARERFSIISRFAYANKTSIIEPIWNLSPEIKHSGYNLFKKYNNKAFGANGEITDASALYASNGSLALPVGIDLKAGEEKLTFELSWTKDEYNYKNQHEDTLVYATLIDNLIFDIVYTNVKRKDLSSVIRINEYEDLNDYVYIFFTNKDKSAFSNSRALRFKNEIRNLR